MARALSGLVIRRILAALDETERAAVVFRSSIELARQYGAQLVLFRAVDVPPEFPPAAATHTSDFLGRKLLSDGQRELEQLAERARSAGVSATVEVVSAADVSRAILAAAEATGVDAIVVGSHGYRRIVDRVLGTNAARVADRAQCTVIVIHDATHAPDSGDLGNQPVSSAERADP